MQSPSYHDVHQTTTMSIRKKNKGKKKKLAFTGEVVEQDAPGMATFVRPGDRESNLYSDRNMMIYLIKLGEAVLGGR